MHEQRGMQIVTRVCMCIIVHARTARRRTARGMDRREASLDGVEQLGEVPLGTRMARPVRPPRDIPGLEPRAAEAVGRDLGTRCDTRGDREVRAERAGQAGPPSETSGDRVRYSLPGTGQVGERPATLACTGVAIRIDSTFGSSAAEA